MDENAEESTEAPTLEVPFKGRTIHMTMPSPEQILVWRRTLRTFESLDTEALSAAEALNAIDRAVRIITSLFALPKDRDWLDDGLLDKEITLSDLLVLFADTVEAFSAAARAASGADDNRESRRAVSKVTRKAPSARVSAKPKSTTKRAPRKARP